MEDSAGLVDQAGGCCTRRRVDQLLHERPAQGDGGSHADVASWTVHADTHSWAFGTGNYGYNRGYVYVDDASFMRWTIAWLVDKSNMGRARSNQLYHDRFHHDRVCGERRVDLRSRCVVLRRYVV
jgi:hypothetical protein